MLRLISVILVLAGIAAVAYGWMQMTMPGALDASDEPIPKTSESRVSSSTQPSFERDPADDDMFRIQTGGSDFLDSLRSVPIAYETPATARFGRAFDVTLSLDATGDDSASDALPGEGNIVESEALISADVQATLTGDAFDIRRVTPAIQTISPLQENVWRWRVTPQETGAQDLTIELFALNEDRAMPVRTFRDKVEVRVSRLGQAIAFANALSPIAVVIGGFGSLIAGLFGVFRFFRGR